MMSSPIDAVNSLFSLDSRMNLAARYNIAPQQSVPVVRLVDGRRELAALEWGLLPSWAKERRLSKPLINARSETIVEKPSFRSAYKKRRCLVPANGYYEWTTTDQGKQPYLMQIENGELFALAGIWERWMGPSEDEVIETFALITLEANETLVHIHHRMPVLISPKDYDMWLDALPDKISDPLENIDLSLGDALHFRPVSKRINLVANEGSDLIDPSASCEPNSTPKQGMLF